MHYLRVLPKFATMAIATSLALKEFKCRCNYKSCTHTLVSSAFIEAWNIARTEYGKSLTVNSGFRCQKHNEEVGGVNGSKHTLGKAIDVSIRGLEEGDKDLLIHTLETYFDYVKVYNTFIHAHVNG